MFGYTKEDPKTKEHIDRDLVLYKREKQLEIERDSYHAERKINETIAIKRQESYDALNVFRRKNLDVTLEMEHQYHNDAEKNRTELAKLDAEIENKKELIEQLDSIPHLQYENAKSKAHAEGKDVAIEHLTADVQRLDDLVKFLAGMLPKVEFDKLGLNFTADLTVNDKKEEKKG